MTPGKPRKVVVPAPAPSPDRWQRGIRMLARWLVEELEEERRAKKKPARRAA